MNLGPSFFLLFLGQFCVYGSDVLLYCRVTCSGRNSCQIYQVFSFYAFEINIKKQIWSTNIEK